jgi:hypothetical protein
MQLLPVRVWFVSWKEQRELLHRKQLFNSVFAYGIFNRGRLNAAFFILT